MSKACLLILDSLPELRVFILVFYFCSPFLYHVVMYHNPVLSLHFRCESLKREKNVHYLITQDRVSLREKDLPLTSSRSRLCRAVR